MAYQLKKTLVVATIFSAFNVFSQGSASAVTFNFTQDGWLQGGIVNGNFEGEDLDSDNIISETEVTNFSLAWSGNEEVPTLELTDIPDTWQFSTTQASLISAFTSQGTTFWSYDGSNGSVGIGGFAGRVRASQSGLTQGIRRI